MTKVSKLGEIRDEKVAKARRVAVKQLNQAAENLFTLYANGCARQADGRDNLRALRALTLSIVHYLEHGDGYIPQIQSYAKELR